MAFEIAFQLPVTLETGVIENNSFSENDKMMIEYFNETQQGTFERILGYPVPTQYGVDYDWALSYLNIDPENGESDQKISEIRKIQPEFVNLLSIPLFEPIGWANVYFGILKEDLKKRDFGKTVLIMQDS
jgi:hypothetical protein